MRSRAWQFALLALLGVSALAQDAPTYIERIDVRIANVDVVVTDRGGKVVTGLTADDFELVAGGAPQKIVNFYEAGGAAALMSTAAASTSGEAVARAKAPARRVILFVDNTSLSSAQRRKILEQMKTTLAETLSPGDETMIVTYDRALRVRLPFRSDVEAVRAMLDVVANEPGGGDFYRAQAMSAQSEIMATRDQNMRVALAKNYAESAREHLDRSIAAIKEVMATVAGIDGRKIMILASEGLPVHPGMEMFQFIETLHQREFGKDAQEPAVVGRTVKAKGGQQEYQIGPEATAKYKSSAVTEMRTFDSREKIRELTRAANSYGLTLYPLHGGVVTGAQTFDASQGRGNSMSNVMFDLRNNTENAMRIMADQTGGRASVGSQHGDLFAGIRADLTSYYSLGFRAGATGEREVRVRVKKPGRYEVRYRHTLLQKPLEQEVSERVTANLFAASSGDSSIAMVLGPTAPHAEGKVRVPVKISVPYDWLTLLDKGDRTFGGAFDVYIAVVDQNGAVSPVARRSQGVVVRDLAEARGRMFPYTLQFLMNRTARRVSVAVVDTTTQLTSFASHDVALQ